MKCPYCNQKHTDTMKFCPNTGKKLPIQRKKCNVCGKTISSQDQKYCSNCGNKLIEGNSPLTTKIPDKAIIKTKKFFDWNYITLILFTFVNIGGGIMMLFLGELRIAFCCLLFGGVLGGLYYYLIYKE